MVVLMVFATLCGVLQLAALGTATRSIRIGTLGLAIVTGCYGCGVIVALTEYLGTHAYSDVSGHPLIQVVQGAARVTDPLIEEVVKALPVLAVVVVQRRYRAQWGLTDHLLMGAGLGAGFGFLETVLQVGWRASRAHPVDGGFTVVASILSTVHVPGLASTLFTWLPAPAYSQDALGLDVAFRANQHLVWTALVSFGIGVLMRVRGGRRWWGLVPVMFACADHSAYNIAARPAEPIGPIVWLLTALHPVLWLWPLLALGLAVALDLRALRPAATDDLLLDVELAARTRSAGLVALARLAPPWTAVMTWRFVLLRRSARYAEARPAAGTTDLRVLVVALVNTIDAAPRAEAFRRAHQALALRLVPPSHLARQRWTWLWLLLLAPTIAYYVVGAVPAFAALQEWLANPAIVTVIVLLTVVGVVWLLRALVVLARRQQQLAQEPCGEPFIRGGLRLLTASGSLVGSACLVIAWGSGRRDGADVVAPAFHLLEALGQVLMVAALILALLAIVTFPPLTLVAVEGAGAVFAVTVSAELVGTLGAAAVLGTSGYVLSVAGGESPATGSSAAPDGADAARVSRLEDLARDPAHGGRITDGTRREAEVGLEMEEAGVLRGPIRRSTSPDEEFVDANGAKWDVKGFRSDVSGRGVFDARKAYTNIGRKTNGGIGVIIDTKFLSPDDVTALRELVENDSTMRALVKWW